MTPVLPTGEGWSAVQEWIEQTEQRLAKLESPASPTLVFTCTRANLPTPINHINCVVRISDLNILAASDGVHWIRQDTGATA